MTKQTQQKTGPSDYQVLMNWVRDGNTKSEYPKPLVDSKVISPVYFLNYFLTSPRYFVWINNNFNNFNLFKLNVVDLMRLFKEIVHNTGYSSFSKKKVQPKDNELVGMLKEKFPYYKKEEILMAVKIIDESEDKDTIYEMFGINNKSKVKKLTKAEVKDRQKKIDGIINSKDVLGLI